MYGSDLLFINLTDLLFFVSHHHDDGPQSHILCDDINNGIVRL